VLSLVQQKGSTPENDPDIYDQHEFLCPGDRIVQDVASENLEQKCREHRNEEQCSDELPETTKPRLSTVRRHASLMKIHGALTSRQHDAEM
jgi:hypothetical protein